MTARTRVAGSILVMLLVTLLAGCTRHSATAAEVDRLDTLGPFPTVSGDFGTVPSVSFDPKMTPATKLQRKILHRGHGPALAVGDLIATDYIGQIWNGKVFNNSYTSGHAAVLQFGLRKLLPGIDAGLLGVPVGSRVELTVPPSDGFGTTGDSATGIKGSDTLVYVFDIGQRFNGKSSGSGSAVSMPPGLPRVSGSLSAAPLIAVGKGLALPKHRVTELVSRGNGPTLQQGSAIVQYYSVNWDGGFVSSTWLQGTPTSIPVGNADSSTGGLFDSLVGLPVGSRVLIVAPAAPGRTQRANTAVVVVDILAQVGTARQMLG